MSRFHSIWILSLALVAAGCSRAERAQVVDAAFGDTPLEASHAPLPQLGRINIREKEIAVVPPKMVLPPQGSPIPGPHLMPPSQLQLPKPIELPPGLAVGGPTSMPLPIPTMAVPHVNLPGGVGPHLAPPGPPTMPTPPLSLPSGLGPLGITAPPDMTSKTLQAAQPIFHAPPSPVSPPLHPESND